MRKDVTVGTVHTHTDRLKKENKGITLIALVITILILLILAGITIASLTGENGLINRAANAKEQTEIAQEKEILQQAALSAMGKSKSGYVDKADLDIELSKYSEIKETKDATEGIEVTFKSGRMYTVNANGEVAQKTPRIYSDEVKAALTEGKYVTYNGETYRVLYDVNSGYNWIEIVSVNPLEEVTLGYSDPAIPSTAEGYDFTGSNVYFEKARWSYNNAITTLHKNAQKYLTNLADRARCVGSDPENPNIDVEELGYEVTDSDINSYIKTKGYNNKLKTTDNNYEIDYNKLIEIDSYKCPTMAYAYYWFASREIEVVSNNPFNTRGCIKMPYTTGTYLNYSILLYISNNGSLEWKEPAAGFRPVIRLKDSIKITGGAGTSGSPYTIGL